MRKFIKILFLLLVILMITVCSLFQNKAEKYIFRQKKLYGILEEKERKKHVPFCIFLFLVYKTKHGEDIVRNRYVPYLETKNYTGGAHIDMYDAYIYYCYY